MTRDDVLAKLRALKPWLAERGVVRVRLYGSHARDEARSDSDVDLIVELDRPMGLSAFADLEAALSRKLGAKAQLVTEAGLKNRIVRRRALADAIDA